jgi:hypothetical protein
MPESAYDGTYYKGPDGRWYYTTSGLLVPGADEDEQGMYAPELMIGRALDWKGVAELLGVDPDTARSYRTRPPSPGNPLPPAVGRHGWSLAFSAPVIRHWQTSRPGRGWRAGQHDSAPPQGGP